MEFKVEKKSIRLTVGDKSFDMKVPSVMQHLDIREKISQAKPEDTVRLMADYLVSLGLPKDVVEELDYDTFLDLYTFVHSSKKNSVNLS